MSKAHNHFSTLRNFDLGNGQQGALHSLPQLEKAAVGPVSRLPVSIRLVLESVLRNCDGKKVHEANVKELANWKPNVGTESVETEEKLGGLEGRAISGIKVKDLVLGVAFGPAGVLASVLSDNME